MATPATETQTQIAQRIRPVRANTLENQSRGSRALGHSFQMPLRRAVVSLLALAARAAGARGPAARGAATCYAKRYPDLKRKFCNADGACNLRQAKAHFREHGRREGRRFGCDDETNGTAPARVVDGIDEARWCTRHATLPRGGLTQRESFNDPPYAIDARRLHQTRSWVAYLSILSRFGPRRGRRGVSERERRRCNGVRLLAPTRSPRRRRRDAA